MASTVRLFKSHLSENYNHAICSIKTHFGNDSVGADLVTDQRQQSADMEVCLLIFEKYYMRIKGMANLTIQLIKRDNELSAVVVGSGGGSGILNISLGANSEFADECAYVLKELGFVEICQD